MGKSLVYSLIYFCSLGVFLQANPSTPTVVSGAALITQTANALFIGTSSNRTIIDWNDFSIMSGEVTDIRQPSTTSAILNRVTSLNSSTIAGLLRSNGQVFVVNPNGIVISKGGVIDAGAIVCSTLDVMNTEFLAGADMTFSGNSTATVENSGLIKADEGAFLLGRHIIQAGNILSIASRADLGAGASILLKTGNSGIMINAGVDTASGTGIDNTGNIACNQCSLQADGNLYALAIRHTGGISALSTTMVDGQVILRAQGGETLIEQKGAILAHCCNGSGGTVQVLGQTVNILDQASINTENVSGGGEIIIGGDPNDSSILQAINTTVALGAELQSDAKIIGNGGNVVVFATNDATMAGTISARGGLVSGDGGFVEISGLGMLNFTGTVDTRAPNGATGTLLLDPTDITISNAAISGGAFDGGSPTNTFSGTAAAANLNIAALNTALSTNNVVITTTSAFGGTGNITVSAAAVLSLVGHNLTLLADNDITLSSSLTTNSVGSVSVVTLNATRDVVLTSALTGTSLNTVNIIASRDVLLDNAITSLGSTVAVSAGRDIVSQGGTDNTIDTNHCTLTAVRNITITNELNSTGEGSGSTLSWNAGDSITVNNDCDFTSWGLVTMEAVNNITNTDVINMISVDAFEMTTTSGDIDINGGVNLAETTTTLTSANDINVTNLLISNTTADISLISTRDINVGPATSLSQVGSRLGSVSCSTGRDLNVLGGATTNDASQIGYSSTLNVDSDIALTIGRNVNVTAGSNSNNVAIIGHGFFNSGNFAGDIIIHSVGGNVILTGDPGATGTIKFAQIGHTRFSGAATSTITGNIRGSTLGSYANILGDLILNAGDDADDFALFGHGGRDSNANETYSGEIRVQANSITLNGGTSTDCYAAIGFYAIAVAGAGTNPIVVTSPASVEVISKSTITMTADTDGTVAIGARAVVDNTHPAMLDVDLVSVQSAGNLVMTSGSGVVTDATIGAFCETGGTNTASTAISMNIGGDLIINAGTGAVAQIINGVSTTDAKDINIVVTGDITPSVSGTLFGAFIQGTTGNASVTASGTISMVDVLTRIENQGGSNGYLNVGGGYINLVNRGFIRNTGTGPINVTVTKDLTIAGPSTFISSIGAGTYLVGRDITLLGSSAAEEAYIENSAGDLLVIAGRDTTLFNHSRIDNLGTGNVTLVVDNQFPTPPGIGPGSFSLSSFATVGRVGGGPLRIFTAVREQNHILGTSNLNGTTFVPGPLFVNSATEEWGVYYPGGFSGVPFTIFYKNTAPVPPVIPPTTAQIVTADPNAFVPFSELFYILEGYPMDPVWAWCYTVCVNDECLWLSSMYRVKENMRIGYDILHCRSLPPYIRRLDLRQYP